MNPHASARGRAFLFQELGIDRRLAYRWAAIALLLIGDLWIVANLPGDYTKQYVQDPGFSKGYWAGARANAKPPIYHLHFDKETYPLAKAEVEAQISEMLGNAHKRK